LCLVYFINCSFLNTYKQEDGKIEKFAFAIFLSYSLSDNISKIALDILYFCGRLQYMNILYVVLGSGLLLWVSTIFYRMYDWEVKQKQAGKSVALGYLALLLGIIAFTLGFMAVGIGGADFINHLFVIQ